MMEPTLEEIMDLVDAEVARARSLHPNNGFTTSDFLVALGEEFGESCEAHLDGEKDELKTELIQTMAVCVRILQEAMV